MSNIDSTQRFSNRADVYTRFRPTYPLALIDDLISATHLSSDSKIADVGSGTGKLTKLLLQRELNVKAVEPNEAMRKQAEAELNQYPGFTSINGTAENTTLPDKSIDLITAAQAFHWFDKPRCKAEFQRILKPSGKVALIWNSRESTASEFMKSYAYIIDSHPNDLPIVSHYMDKSEFQVFFKNCEYKTYSYKWSQLFDFESLFGRAQSSSYSPLPGHPNHELLKTGLKELFDQYNKDGYVEFFYIAEMFIGEV